MDLFLKLCVNCNSLSPGGDIVIFHGVAVTWIWRFSFDEKSTGNFYIFHRGSHCECTF